MATELERKRNVIKHQMRLPWKIWADEFVPIENPRYPGTFKFEQSDSNFIEAQEMNCVWTVYYPYGQNDVDYLYIRPGFEGYEADTFNGCLISQNPFSEELASGWEQTQFFMMPVHAICYCDAGCSVDPNCSFCEGAEVLEASVIQAE